MEEMSIPQPAPYLVYVLRLWCDGSNTPWRATLECARTGEQLPFTDLTALFAFLEAETQTSLMLSGAEYSKDTVQVEKSQIDDA